MRKLWQMLAVLTMVAALGAPGYAKPGNGGGHGNKPIKEKHSKPIKEKHNNGNHGKPSNESSTSATFTVGQVLVTDDRVLDLSGDYALSSTSSTVVTSDSATLLLSLLQDDRGKLAGNATVTLPDGTTTDVPVVGRLGLTGRDGDLRLSLAGSIGSEEDDDDDSNHHRRGKGHHGKHDDSDDDDEGTSSSDDMTSSVSVQIRGEWDGTAFQVEVKVVTDDDTIEFDGSITPVNALRGFSIEPATSSQRHGRVLFSERTIVLPWGDETARAMQINNRGFQFRVLGGDFRADLRGKVDTSATVTLSRARFDVGYGHIDVDPDEVTVLPAVQ